MVLRLRASVLTSLAVLLLVAAMASPVVAHDELAISQLEQDYRAEGFILQWDEERALPRKMINATWNSDYRGKVVVVDFWGFW